MGEFIESVKLYSKEKRIKKIIKNKWNYFIKNKYNLKPDDTNKKLSDLNLYDIGEVFIKEYGFDVIILPCSRDFNEFRNLIPSISSLYKANVIAEQTKTKSSIYMRVHLINLPINEIDYIKFKWYSLFYEKKYRNGFGETFKLTNKTELFKNGQKDEIIGFEFNVEIPNGMGFDVLKNKEAEISQIIHKCLITNYKNIIKIKFITTPLSDTERFYPVKLKNPYSMYVGMKYDYTPLISSLEYSPHMMVSGKSQTGKTVSIITSLANLCYQFNEDKMILFCSMISGKQDLRIFKGVSNLKYYANTIDTTLRLLKYLHKEMNRRNRMFEDSKKFCHSMYKWNELYPKKRMPILLAAFDEMTLYMPSDSDKKDPSKKQLYLQKQECVDLIRTLITESASSGINIIFILQRPDKESLPPFVKAQIGLKVGFYQPNTATSLVAMDNDSCTHIEMKREAVVSYEKGEELMRTLFVTNDQIINMLKDKIDIKNKTYNLNKNGEITENQPILNENTQKTTENEPKSVFFNENSSKKLKTVTRYNKETCKYENVVVEDNTKRNSNRFNSLGGKRKNA